ncbi:hypothetical protein RhiirA4_454918 [Rhizophagus irregularis]|uniref:Ion transport domain-containing protein n=1 Tax=Rhizophagus irregularis TaxID=588596 RepID=A0A2I1G3Y3_9GLOM|nr:hypothetical protein RhiirA4_454918 [Rhizophagus irregularis]
MGDEIIPIDGKQDDVDNEIVPHNPRDPHNAHNGKQVSLVSLSLNGKYVVTYSEDDKSIEGWIVENSEPILLDPEANVYKLPEVVNFITELKVNDKIVCYTYSDSNNINIFEMSTKNQQIKVNPPPENLEFKINFKKDGNLIIFNNDKISIYHSAHDKISLMSSHRLSSYNEVITGVSIDDNNIWIISPHYLFHWDLEKFQLKFSYSLRFTTTYTDEDDEGDKSKNIDKKFTVIHKESLIGVKYCNEIAIFLENVHFPIRNIQLKDTDTKIEFCEVQNNDYLLAFNLPKKDEKKNIVLYNINDINKQPIDVSMIFNENKFILYEYNSESKKAFGLVDGKFSYINLLDLNWHEFFESHKDDDDLVGWNDYLGQTFKYYYNDTLAIPDMENIKSLHSPSKSKNMKEIRSLFSDEYENKNIATKDINFNNQKYKWRIELKNYKLDKLVENPDELGYLDELGKLDKLSVYSDKEFLCSKDLGIKLTEFTRLNWKILNNNALALRLNYDNIIIYEYDIHNKCIKTQYLLYKKEGLIDFSGPILPMIDTKDIANLKKDNHKQYFTQLSESIVSIIEDERCLAKYGPTLLSNLVKSADPKFTRNIEDIYNKCIKLVKEDPKRNMKFLNIITSSMNDLYKKYPDYILKFNSEMFMILDPFNERIHSDGDYSHFCTLCDEVEIRKIDQSIKNIIKSIKLIIELIKLIIATILYLAILILLLPFIPFIIILMIICLIMGLGEMIPFLSIFLLAIPYYIVTSKPFNMEKQRKQQIVLIIPYIDYSRYPLEYSFWKEIFYPQSSVFVNTCKKEFYSNWNGEAIINFKWKAFGRIYYFIIWSIFMVFLVCFTIASYPTNSITQKVRISLYQTSIAFGFFHLIFELRQFIWNPRKYFSSIWNLFDLSAYLSATIASIYWIKYDDIPDWALSITCILLDLKFLLFFRIFEYFGIYFAIIFGVAKRVFSFLLVLAIIIASFAHGFFLLLHPRNLLDSLNEQNPNDSNNPWTLSNTYNQVDENGNILNETLIQVPSENTNLFYSYPTSLLATYLFLTGNQNSLSPWAPKPTTENTILFILMAVFSFLIVIYLMNLFIGLLNMAIEKDNDRALYLVQKAEVIAEIELFYLLPHQRRWRSWFPEVIYCRVDVEKTRIYIKEAIKKGKWNMDDWPEMKHKILKRLSVDDAIIDLAV